MISVTDIFSTQIYRNELPGWLENVSAIVNKHLSIAKEEQHGSVIQTYELKKQKDLLFFCDYVINECSYALYNQGYNVAAYDFKIESIWGQEFSCGGYNSPHIHPCCSMVGLYFLEVPKESIEVGLHDPRPGKIALDLDFRSDKGHNAHPSFFLSNIKPGSLVFFNGWLNHSISLGRVEEKLKFLHFNITSVRKE